MSIAAQQQHNDNNVPNIVQSILSFVMQSKNDNNENDHLNDSLDHSATADDAYSMKRRRQIIITVCKQAFC